MLYAKLNANGTVLNFPYTEEQLYRDHPNVSFPNPLTASDLQRFNVVIVDPTPAPVFDHTVNPQSNPVNNNGKWMQQWTNIPASQAEIAQRTSIQSATVRGERDRRLAASDWTQLPDANVNTANWAAYRQQLRDVSSQAEFPWNVEWPVAPNS